MKQDIILLAVCTFERPEMLRRCLTSLCQLKKPEHIEVKLLVVDNECSATTKRHVETYEPEILYAEEKTRGISFARNKALKLAIDLHADWVIFIDDDQIAPSDWLINMMTSQSQTKADVVRSSVRFRDENNHIVYEPKAKWFHNLEFSTTNGVLFTSRLISVDGMGLKFDELYALSGGSDRYFFLQASLQGASIVETPLAILEETLPNTRASYIGRLRRQFFQAWVEAQQDMRLWGRQRGMSRIFRTYVPLFFKGLLSIGIGALLHFSHRSYASRKIEKSTYQLGRSLGAFWGILHTRLPRMYEKIDGH